MHIFYNYLLGALLFSFFIPVHRFLQIIHLSSKFAFLKLYWVSLRNISDASVGTEELAHLEMVSTIVHQLTQNLSMDEIENSGFGPYYIDHTIGVWPQAAGGVPLNSCEFQSKGDPITDLFENLAADGAPLKEQHLVKNSSESQSEHLLCLVSVSLRICSQLTFRQFLL